MTKPSAGLLLYRVGEDLEVFLVHLGGPYWVKKDLGSWSIPKGEYEPGKDAFEAAKREFTEETGFDITGEFRALTPLKQPSGKMVEAWAVEGDADPNAIRSNTFCMEWPPGSGRTREFPEVDRAAWFPLAEARRRIFKGQLGFLDELAQRLAPNA